MSVASLSTATSESDGDLESAGEPVTSSEQDSSIQVSQEGRNFIKRLLLKVTDVTLTQAREEKKLFFLYHVLTFDTRCSKKVALVIY